jgi:hypothetical protein
VKEINYRTYQWEGEGEELQNIALERLRGENTEHINGKVKERSYRAYQWEREGEESQNIHIYIHILAESRRRGVTELISRKVQERSY